MKPSIDTKIVTYLLNHPSGVSGSQIRAWLDSCRRDNGYTMQEQESGLLALRDSGRVACTNGVWWLKDIPSDWLEKDLTKQKLKAIRKTLLT